jgi:2-polyprenyl-3-methyl-5-hydroxy-6-metoxy-1,4-benzoquinol methylase
VTNSPDYLKPYIQAVDEHGGTFDATLWQSKEGQLLRFKTFCDFIDFNSSSIVDVGCGIGDFAEYLIAQNIQFDSFHGIDAMEAMITTANNRSIARSSFSVADILQCTNALTGYEWITFSGTLNAMSEQTATQLIDAAFSACKKGVAFNFLSNKSGRDPKNEDLQPASRFNTIALLEFALSKTPCVDFAQTYLNGHDATIVLKKCIELPQ